MSKEKNTVALTGTHSATAMTVKNALVKSVKSQRFLDYVFNLVSIATIIEKALNLPHDAIRVASQ